MDTFAPIVVCWLYAGVHMLLPPQDRYRLHTRKEEEQKNPVPILLVIKGVLLQQFVQATVAQTLFSVNDLKGKLYRDHGSTINSHRSCAHNSCNAGHGHLAVFCAPVHAPQEVSIPPHPLAHRLVVPYAIGALCNHPLEGLLLDTFGGAISFLISGMTARTSVIFFCFAMIKTVDDHCGLWLPGNIFHTIFQNNTAYHGIHHQLQIGTSSLGPICLTH
ncbi:hypothetical protein MRB53_021922 [Persea americana]|uniref:Uncharacterized protein n=1 Tax=Persea americana TaxID=3435 RepID=A0ACC2L574_PERAE|nr:hypothetical protein MRB53_021922 [Persea americana]